MRLYYVFLMPNNRVVVKHQNERHTSDEETALDCWQVSAHTKDAALGIIFTNLYNQVKKDAMHRTRMYSHATT